MVWTTFIATDLQLFIVLPFIIGIYRCSQKAGTVLLVLMILVGSSIAAIVIWVYDIMPGYLFALDIDMIQFALLLYIKLDCLAFGVLLAMLYLKIQWWNIEATHKEKSKEGCLKWLHQTIVAPWVLWFGSLLCAAFFMLSLLAVDFLAPDNNGDNFPDIPPNASSLRVINAVLMACGRLSAMLSLSLFMLFLFTGNSSFYFQILGNNFWQTLRKLLFGSFLVSPIFSRAYLVSQPSPSVPLTAITFVQLYIFSIFGAFVVSSLLYMAVECPLTDLFKLLVSDFVRLANRGRSLK